MKKEKHRLSIDNRRFTEVIPLRFERKTHALEGFIYFYRY